MIVALLVLIVLILLFGAAAVKGWIRSTVVALIGFAAICTALIWLGSFFGENGFLYVIMAIGGILLLLSIIGLFINPEADPGERARRRRQNEQFRKRKG